MLRLIKFLFTGDWHLCKWKALEVYTRRRADKSIIAYVHVRECETCGKIKTFPV